MEHSDTEQEVAVIPGTAGASTVNFFLYSLSLGFCRSFPNPANLPEFSGYLSGYCKTRDSPWRHFVFDAWLVSVSLRLAHLGRWYFCFQIQIFSFSLSCLGFWKNLRCACSMSVFLPVLPVCLSICFVCLSISVFVWLSACSCLRVCLFAWLPFWLGAPTPIRYIALRFLQWGIEFMSYFPFQLSILFCFWWMSWTLPRAPKQFDGWFKTFVLT